LARTGFVTSTMLRHGRRYAIVAIFASAAILTPPDAMSMVIMALPTIALYEVSILAVQFVEKRQATATPAS
jgi:sec-independent protein translocase protein TatC